MADNDGDGQQPQNGDGQEDSEDQPGQPQGQDGQQGDDDQPQDWKSHARRWERRAKDSARQLEQLNTRLREFEDRDKTEAERLAEQAVAAEDRAKELETELLRRDVAEEKGLPKKLWRFVTGDTREDMEAAADELAAGVGDARPSPPDLKQGQRSGGNGKPGQLTHADLGGMTSAEINQARKEGRLDRLMGKTV